jgi:hypothetical protein
LHSHWSDSPHSDASHRGIGSILKCDECFPQHTVTLARCICGNLIVY